MIVQTSEALIDLRVLHGRIWNRADLNRFEPIHETRTSKFLYRGFQRYGIDFVRSVHGRFGAAYHDQKKDVVFLCRDWVGEVPLYYYLTDDSIVVANRIADIQTRIGPERYRYQFVRAVPHSHALLIDVAGQYVFGHATRKAWRVHPPLLYYDFANDPVGVWSGDNKRNLDEAVHAIRCSLERSVRERLEGLPTDRPLAVLLSGGIDSLTVAYLVKKHAGKRDIVAYTLAVGSGGHDVRQARAIAQHFGLESRVVTATPADLVSGYAEAVQTCELYHIANVYCAVGIRALGKALKKDGIATAFCGEGVNEALGDYRDWVIRDPATKKERTLQRVDHDRLCQTSERALYVWGQPRKEGRYNLQLGTGLAKHGIGRMVKPLIDLGVQLECPYLDAEVMRRLVSIPYRRLEAVDGKPGLMAKVFADEVARGSIPEEFFFKSQKIRLQDASELGESGITPVLQQAGFGQTETIRIFNQQFGANLDPVLDAERLTGTSG